MAKLTIAPLEANQIRRALKEESVHERVMAEAAKTGYAPTHFDNALALLRHRGNWSSEDMQLALQEHCVNSSRKRFFGTEPNSSEIERLREIALEFAQVQWRYVSEEVLRVRNEMRSKSRKTERSRKEK